MHSALFSTRGKGCAGIDGDRRHQRLDALQIESLDRSARLGLQLAEAADADRFLRQAGTSFSRQQSY